MAHYEEIQKIEEKLGILSLVFDIVSHASELSIKILVSALTIIINITGVINGFYKHDASSKRQLTILLQLYQHDDSNVIKEVTIFPFSLY